MQEEVFGFNFGANYEELKPEERYGAVIQEIMASPAGAAKMAFERRALDDSTVRGIVMQAKDLAGDLGRWRGLIEPDYIRTRSQDESLSRA